MPHRGVCRSMHQLHAQSAQHVCPLAGVPLRNSPMIQRCTMRPKAIYLAPPKLLAPAQVAERRIMEDCIVAAWKVTTSALAQANSPKAHTPRTELLSSTGQLCCVLQSGTPACLPKNPWR